MGANEYELSHSFHHSLHAGYGTYFLFFPYFHLSVKRAAGYNLAEFRIGPYNLQDGTIVCFPGVIQFPLCDTVAGFIKIPYFQSLIWWARYESFPIVIVSNVMYQVFVSGIKACCLIHGDSTFEPQSEILERALEVKSVAFPPCGSHRSRCRQGKPEAGSLLQGIYKVCRSYRVYNTRMICLHNGIDREYNHWKNTCFNERLLLVAIQS